MKGGWWLEMGLPAQTIPSSALGIADDVVVPEGELWIAVGNVAYGVAGEGGVLRVISALELSRKLADTRRFHQIETFMQMRTDGSAYHTDSLFIVASDAFAKRMAEPFRNRGYSGFGLHLNVADPARCEGGRAPHSLVVERHPCDLPGLCDDADKALLVKSGDDLYAAGPLKIWIRIRELPCVELLGTASTGE